MARVVQTLLQYVRFMYQVNVNSSVVYRGVELACSVCFDFVKRLIIEASLSCSDCRRQVVARFMSRKTVCAAASNSFTVPIDGFSAQKVGGISIVFCWGRHPGCESFPERRPSSEKKNVQNS